MRGFPRPESTRHGFPALAGPCRLHGRKQLPRLLVRYLAAELCRSCHRSLDASPLLRTNPPSTFPPLLLVPHSRARLFASGHRSIARSAGCRRPAPRRRSGACCPLCPRCPSFSRRGAASSTAPTASSPARSPSRQSAASTSSAPAATLPSVASLPMPWRLHVRGADRLRGAAGCGRRGWCVRLGPRARATGDGRRLTRCQPPDST